MTKHHIKEDPIVKKRNRMSKDKRQFLYEDGRRAERHVFDEGTECDGETITEVYVEPPIQKNLAQRVVEKRRPCVYERETEYIDEATGEVIDRVKESADPSAPLTVVEHLVSRQALNSQKTITSQDVVRNSECVSRDDVRQDIRDAFDEYLNRVGPLTAPKEKVSVQSTLEEKYDGNSANNDWVDWLLYGVMAAIVAGIIYVLFVM